MQWVLPNQTPLQAAASSADASARAAAQDVLRSDVFMDDRAYVPPDLATVLGLQNYIDYGDDGFEDGLSYCGVGMAWRRYTGLYKGKLMPATLNGRRRKLCPYCGYPILSEKEAGLQRWNRMDGYHKPKDCIILKV